MKHTDSSPGEKWYDRFSKTTKPSRHDKKQTGSPYGSHTGKNRNADTPGDRFSGGYTGRGTEQAVRTYGNGNGTTPDRPVRTPQSPDAVLTDVRHLFDASAVPKDAREVLLSFTSIVQGVFPANGRQLLALPGDIRQLSHELTDERSERRVGYMNSPASLAAYTRYFMWWNLVRLTRLFANLGSGAFPVSDGDNCLDAGSGPLTVVTALWLACPELRAKKLTWYCMDISPGTLALGEDLYLSAAARTPPADQHADPHWNIIRVKGALGTEIRGKASLITCANMLNELFQDGQYAPEDLAQKYSASLLSYAAEKHTVLVVEPGVPKQARIISLLRDSFIKKNMSITAPCPHAQACAMNGLHARTGGTAKWCNFAFATDDAPQQLLKLSADTGIPKERAVLSFVLATNAVPAKAGKTGDETGTLKLRIASDPIRLPGHRTGYYACSGLGLTLAVTSDGITFKSGDTATVRMVKETRSLRSDAKTGAREVSIGKEQARR